MSSALKPHNPDAGVNKAVIFLFLFLLSFVWGISFSNAPQLEKALNNKAIITCLMLFFITLFVLYTAVSDSNKQKNRLAAVEDFFEAYQWLLITLLSVSYAFIMSIVSLLKHQAFETHTFDLAIFDQAIWSITKSRFLFSSIKGNICLLGDHMSPVLVLFAPLYWIWNDAGVLLVTQATITAFCFFPLALIAQEKLGKGIFPVFFSLALYFYQPLRHSVRAEFHPELLANPILFFAFYFLLKGKIKLFLSMLIAVVLCKENMYGIVFAFGLYLLLNKRFKMGLLLATISMVLFYLTTHTFIPLMNGAHYAYISNYNYLFTGKWGNHLPLIVQPLGVLEYLYKIFLPLGFLSFLHPPTLLLALPVLFQNMLSRSPSMHSIAFQYTAGLTPGVFISAIFGTTVLLRFFNGNRYEKLLRIGMLGAMIMLSVALAGRPERHYFFKYKTSLKEEHKRLVKKAIRQIPERFSVIANENLGPHMSHRFQVNQFEDYQRMPEGSTYSLVSDLVILDRELTAKDINSEVKKVQDSGYKIVYQVDGFYIFQRNDLQETIKIN